MAGIGPAVTVLLLVLHHFHEVMVMRKKCTHRFRQINLVLNDQDFCHVRFVNLSRDARDAPIIIFHAQ